MKSNKKTSSAMKLLREKYLSPEHEFSPLDETSNEDTLRWKLLREASEPAAAQEAYKRIQTTLDQISDGLQPLFIFDGAAPKGHLELTIGAA